MKSITVQELKEMIDKGSKFILIDVRTKMEYGIGHIRGSILISYDQIMDIKKFSEINKDDKLIVYCRTDSRSRIAAARLIDLGYNDVSYVINCYIGWTQNGYPISR